MEPSAGCFVCDRDNSQGLGIRFYTDGQAAYGEYTPPQVYQGYDGVVHGGILATLLDEVMAKGLAVHGIDGVTGKLEIRFRKPVPTGVKLLLKGWVKSQRRASFVVAGEIRGENGETMVEAEGIFFGKASER
jgi:acyl-coenzyme A thioesterase PaaI-like protein